MLDDRIYTFLKLCKSMNYRKTAEELHMTQPAVTQHIHYLEKLYGTKLFEYNNHVLSLTESGQRLEQYARPVIYNENIFRQQLASPKRHKLSVGTTKTIGEYEMNELVNLYVSDDTVQFELIIDNTLNLLRMLDNLELDFLIVEGYFDKNEYGFIPYKTEELVGICAAEHHFAGKAVSLRDVFNEHILVREHGSGTRKVFENFLEENNYSYKSFSQYSVISSFKLMESLIANDLGITFAYRTIAEQNPSLSVFRLKDQTIFHEFNFVFLKNSKSSELIASVADTLQRSTSL